MSLINLFKRKKKVFKPLKLTVELTINSKQELDDLTSALLYGAFGDRSGEDNSEVLRRLLGTLRKELIED